jgi:DNA-binding transcriptional ArsR family regulator
MEPTTADPARGVLDRLAVLRALADPVRLAVVDELVLGSACACELRARLDISAPLLSHHLKVLRGARLVRCRKAGRRVEVEIDRAHLDRLGHSLITREPVA